MSYKIIITPDAEEDLLALRDYIAYKLFAPQTAISYLQKLRKRIESLSEMPARIKMIDDEPWHSRAIRRLIVNNFFVYFRIDEEENTVYILNVIYSKRDQLACLEEKATND